MNTRLAWLVAAATGLLGCDLVLGLDQYKESAGTAAGGAGSTSGSMTTSGTMTSGSMSTSSSTGGGPCTPGTMVDCYDGPAGTENVGLCRKGQGTCKADGMGVESCLGEVTPQTENPNVVGDENCDGVASGDVEFASNVGESCGVVAPSGDLLVGGGYLDKLTLGPDTIDVDEFFVYAGNFGSMLEGKWARLLLDNQEVDAKACAADSESNLLVGGPLSNAPFWTPAPGVGGIIGKIRNEGTPLWARTCVGTSVTGGKSGQIYGTAVDSQDNVIVVGVAPSPMNCGGTNVSGPGGGGIFIAKFAKDGTELWVRLFGDPTNATGGSIQNYSGPALSVAVDSKDNIWITGECKGTYGFGGTPLACGSPGDAFIAKFAPAGAHVFSNRFGATSNQLGAAIRVAPDDGPVVVFLNEGSIDVGGGPQSAPSVIAKFNDAGTYQWNRPVQVRLGGLALDPSGGGAVAGNFSGTIDLGGGPLTAVSGTDGFLWHFDSSGNHLYARQYAGAPGSGYLQATTVIASDASGAFYLTGYHFGLVDYGTGVVPGDGRFTLKVAP